MHCTIYPSFSTDLVDHWNVETREVKSISLIRRFLDVWNLSYWIRDAEFILHREQSVSVMEPDTGQVSECT